MLVEKSRKLIGRHLVTVKEYITTREWMFTNVKFELESENSCFCQSSVHSSTQAILNFVDAIAIYTSTKNRNSFENNDNFRL